MTRRTLGTEAVLRQALDEVRRRGWALSDQETEEGVRTIAVPVLDRTMKVQAAMNVSGHATRVSLSQLQRRYLPVLKRAAQETSRALGAPIG